MVLHRAVVSRSRQSRCRALGREQFDWLKETLESSDATFKFVFLHSLVGGYDSPFGGSRGGHIYAEYFEYVKMVEDCDVADCSYVADTYTIPANWS